MCPLSLPLCLPSCVPFREVEVLEVPWVWRGWGGRLSSLLWGTTRRDRGTVLCRETTSAATTRYQYQFNQQHTGLDQDWDCQTNCPGRNLDPVPDPVPGTLHDSYKGGSKTTQMTINLPLRLFHAEIMIINTRIMLTSKHSWCGVRLFVMNLFVILEFLELGYLFIILV